MDKITPFISPAYSVPVPKSVSSVIIDIGLDDRYKVPGSSFRVALRDERRTSNNDVAPLRNSISKEPYCKRLAFEQSLRRMLTLNDEP